jgi:hypothetical protein
MPQVADAKGRAQRRHAKRRALERLGVQLNHHDLAEIVEQIRERRSRFIERQSCRVAIHEVQHAGQTFVVAYDKLRRTVATVMPAEWWQE